MPPVTLAEAASALELEVLVAAPDPNRAVTGAVACDLLSWVMAGAKPGNLWFTVQTHVNVVAVALLAGASGVVFTAGFAPDEDTLARAEEEGVALFASPLPAYPLAGRLWSLGVG